jgi:ATP-dependent RNA helicase RhlE
MYHVSTLGEYMSFESLSLKKPLLKAILEKGYETPSPIQEAAIPLLIQGKDVLGRAETGTGKTAAFALPIIQHLHEAYHEKTNDPMALIIAPTRELVEQIKESFKHYGKFSHSKVLAVYGGVSINRQKQDVKKGVNILVATPGRLLDLMRQRSVSLNNIKFLVIDEADRMVDMGFIKDVKHIMSSCPKERQTMMFSATLDREVLTIADQYLTKYEIVDVAPQALEMEHIKQSIFYVSKEHKIDLLTKQLATEGRLQTLIFVRTKHGADKLTKSLAKLNYKVTAIHGNKSQHQRTRALELFKKHTFEILVATDVAARGIDIKNLPRIINYDMPEASDSYIHRMGRTGRAGQDGIVYSYCSKLERNHVKSIESKIKMPIPVVSHEWEEVVVAQKRTTRRNPKLSGRRRRR